MIKASLIVLGLMIFPAYGNDLLIKNCEDRGGQVVPTFKCPQSKLQLKWNFCLYSSPSGKQLFFDGCTGPSGGHTELFYPACINHDLCYHHEPVTSGLSRKNCDDKFLTETLYLCAEAEDPEKCRKWAHAMYKVLRKAGDLAFRCEKSVADYR